MNVLEITDLQKEYSGSIIINNVNMQIRQGEIYGLIGRNGAGKTTLMKMITVAHIVKTNFYVVYR